MYTRWCQINQTSYSKALGLNVDENLSRKEHIHAILKTVTSSISALKWVRPFIFDYWSVVWDGLAWQLSGKLKKLQNHAARVVTKSSYDMNSSYLLNSLSWNNLSVTVRGVKQKAKLMYKCVNKLAPVYFCNMFTPRTLTFDLHDKRKTVFTETKNWLAETWLQLQCSPTVAN